VRKIKMSHEPHDRKDNQVLEPKFKFNTVAPLLLTLSLNLRAVQAFEVLPFLQLQLPNTDVHTSSGCQGAILTQWKGALQTSRENKFRCQSASSCAVLVLECAEGFAAAKITVVPG